MPRSTLLFLLFLLFLLGPPAGASVSPSPSSPRKKALCPGECVCYEASDLVDCASRDLTHIPHHVPHGTWLLDLSQNQLREIRSGTFSGLWSLRILLMSNNSLQALQPQSLSSLQFLERLDLSFNQLLWLPRDFSQSLYSLQELRLDHNLLQGLSAPSLAHFDSMRKLDLSYNMIATLEVGVLKSLSRLSFLNLEGNRLSVLPGGLWTRQQRLEVLLLGHNNLTELDQEVLTPLRSLSLLSLQGNQMEHLNFKTFVSLHTVSTHVQLSLNPWFCDCDLHRVFSKFQHVRHLHVDDYADIRCRGPPQLAHMALADMDTELCMAETLTVLGITCTVMLAVVGALFKAERNRKSKKEKAMSGERDDPLGLGLGPYDKRDHLLGL